MYGRWKIPKIKIKKIDPGHNTAKPKDAYASSLKNPMKKDVIKTPII